MGRHSIARCLAALLLIILLISPALSVSAADESYTVTDGKSLVLYDKTHKQYIIEENCYEIVNTSTSAKIVMGLVSCEALSDRLDESVTVTEEMLTGASGYSMRLSIGEKIKVRDLLYGAICGSYNDAAYVLAHVVSGSTEAFVEMMNTRALEAGVKNTKYTNPLGYPDNSAMVTTAYDTLKIAVAASENPLYMEICSAMKHTVEANNKSLQRVFFNRNYLVSGTDYRYYNTSCAGMNAGYSGEAGGWSIVTLIRDEEKEGVAVEYICILLGGSENEDGSEIYAYDTVSEVADWVCETYNSYKIFPKDTELGKTKIGVSMTNDAPYVTANDLYVYIPTSRTDNELAYSVTLDENIRAPISAGEIVGKVTVTSNGIKIGECDLVLKESYEANGVMKVIDAVGSYTKSRAFIATLICFAVLLVSMLIVRYFKGFNRRGRYKRRR